MFHHKCNSILPPPCEPSVYSIYAVKKISLLTCGVSLFTLEHDCVVCVREAVVVVMYPYVNISMLPLPPMEMFSTV